MLMDKSVLEEYEKRLEDGIAKAEADATSLKWKLAAIKEVLAYESKLEAGTAEEDSSAD